MKKPHNYGLTISGRASAETESFASAFAESCQRRLLAGDEPLGGPIILQTTPGNFIFFQAWITNKESE